MLWFNCELRIETGNEKHKTKMPHRFTTFDLTFQNKIWCMFSFQKRERNLRKTLEVYNVKTLEVYNVKH